MFYGKSNLVCVVVYLPVCMHVRKQQWRWREIERASEHVRELRCSDVRFVFLEVVLIIYGFFSDLQLG